MRAYRVDPHRCGIGAGVASRCGYASGVLRSTFTCTVCVCVCLYTHVRTENRALAASPLSDQRFVAVPFAGRTISFRRTKKPRGID